jgi:TolB protein
VHLASDAVVQWAFGEPGIAATRIAFSRRMDDGTQDLWLVDSDGENLRRLTRYQVMGFGQPITLGPSWSPDGQRIAYTSYKAEGMPRIYEMNLVTGEEKSVPVSRDGDYITPMYHPDGERIYFGVNGGGRNGIYSYNIARGCCFTTIFEGRSNDLSPSFSADGTRMAFNSNRLGDGAPQIYVMPSDGSGRPELVSPYVYGREGFYTSPDWCRTGGMMLFHGRVFERGAHQILVADMGRRGPLVQLTFEGVNEDPSCAPDGRHVVHAATRSSGLSLRIVDMVTGHERTLVSGIEAILPAWSPPLVIR